MDKLLSQRYIHYILASIPDHKAKFIRNGAKILSDAIRGQVDKEM